MNADPDLLESYDACRRLLARHGKTYYLASLLLPPARRPGVHALYGFARYTDEIVDDIEDGRTAAARAVALSDWSQQFLADLTDGTSSDPVCMAVIDTAVRYEIPVDLFSDFLNSMAMDLVIDGYPTYAELQQYMWGSAAVIGLQMLPVLGLVAPYAEARGPATALGYAFQLSNFLRDIAEDLRRGRIYLPAEDLVAHGVTREKLEAGIVDDAFRSLMAFEIDRTRRLYAEARPGIDLVRPESRDCLRVAHRLYGGILDEIERADYQVLDRRVRVPTSRRLAVAAPAYARARWARLVSGRRR